MLIGSRRHCFQPGGENAEGTGSTDKEQRDDLTIRGVPLTVLCEEVTVNDFDQTVQLLNGQQAHGDIEDEISKHFAVKKKRKKNHN